MGVSDIQLSIVVPVYNSAPTLPLLISGILEAIQTLQLPAEIILVNDASTDTSWQAIQQLAQTHTAIVPLQMPVNSGQWRTTLHGISRSRGTCIVTIDDDLEYTPDGIVTLYRYINSHSYKVVFGMAANKYILQGKNSGLAQFRNRLLNAFWGKKPTDSFRIFYRTVVFSNNEFMPTVHLEAYLKRAVPLQQWGYVPVNFQKRVHGVSNHSFFKKLKLFFVYSRHYFKM